MSSPTALGTCYFKPVPHQPWAQPGGTKAPRPVEEPTHPQAFTTWCSGGSTLGWEEHRAGGAGAGTGQGGFPGAVGSLEGHVRIRVDVKSISDKGNHMHRGSEVRKGLAGRGFIRERGAVCKDFMWPKCRVWLEKRLVLGHQ